MSDHAFIISLSVSKQELATIRDEYHTRVEQHMALNELIKTKFSYLRDMVNRDTINKILDM